MLRKDRVFDSCFMGAIVIRQQKLDMCRNILRHHNGCFLVSIVTSLESFLSQVYVIFPPIGLKTIISLSRQMKKILFNVKYQTFCRTRVRDSTPDTMSCLMKCTHAIKYLVNMKVGLSLAICLSIW